VVSSATREVVIGFERPFVIDGSLAARNTRIHLDGRTFSYDLRGGTGGRASLQITQNDVRAIQLAKAALYAGVRLLMERMGIDHVDRIRLAGAFGSHIDVKYAKVLGMIPDCALDCASSAGNAAGTRARIALLDQRARGEIEQLVRRVEKIETAVEPRFQEFFVEAMAIPHLTAPFPCLRAALRCPRSRPPAAIPADGIDDSRGVRARSCEATRQWLYIFAKRLAHRLGLFQVSDLLRRAAVAISPCQQ
jgi:uncharacterized 2Fe-2S/4Fe-4S cluster protein (DUF4445 family)